MVEIETTVCSGFPVIARGSICGPEDDVGIFHPYVDDIEILTASGKPAPFIIKKISAADWARIEEEMLEHV